MTTVTDLERRLASAQERGVVVVDPRQTYIAADVDLARLAPGAVLWPGTRLLGPRTWLGPGSRVGTEGPATLVDTVLDAGAAVASGFVQGAVLLAGASLGAAAHVRAGTLLEEEASTAHAVGLKQTILLPFVTLGSLINFCDCLMAGGTSRRDHSEVGSGYIHFNYTPWGAQGDKATPSLIGDVTHGVFLRERRVFLGGSGGLVGPAQVGYGAVTAAGQVWRGDLAAGRLALQLPRPIDRAVAPGRLDRVQPRAQKNLRYLGELFALRAFYVEVRLARAAAERRPVVEAALANLDLCLEERRRQLARFLAERGAELPAVDPGPTGPCPLPLGEREVDHLRWVQGLGDDEVAAGVEWLAGIVRRVEAAGALLA